MLNAGFREILISNIYGDDTSSVQNLIEPSSSKFICKIIVEANKEIPILEGSMSFILNGARCQYFF